MKCPKHQEFVFEKRSGVEVYVHTDDGSLCDCLNMFDVTPLHVLRTYLEYHSFDEIDPFVIVIFKTCEEARNDLFRELSQASKKVLAKKLERIYQFSQQMHDTTIIQALYEAFGYVLYENLKIVSGTPFVQAIYNRTFKPPTWKMEELDETYGPTLKVSKAAQQMQTAVKERAREIFQATLSEQKKRKR